MPRRVVIALDCFRAASAKRGQYANQGSERGRGLEAIWHRAIRHWGTVVIRAPISTGASDSLEAPLACTPMTARGNACLSGSP